MRTRCGHEEQKKNAKFFENKNLAFQKSTQSRIHRIQMVKHEKCYDYVDNHLIFYIFAVESRSL
jgi:hypothetical protein